MKSLVKRQNTLPAHVAHDRVVQRLQQAEEALAYAVGIDQVPADGRGGDRTGPCAEDTGA